MASLYSLNAFKLGLQDGRSVAKAVKFAREIATELAQDGQLAGQTPEAPAAEEPPAAPLRRVEGHTRENPHPDVADYGEPYAYWVGSKYEKDLTIVEIAKRCRAEIKMLTKKGQLPKGKYQVRIQRYAGGRSMTLTVADLEPGFQLLNPERILRSKTSLNFIPDHECPRYTEVGKALLRKLEAIVGAWNYDRGDSMSDFYCSNYHAFVRIDSDYESAVCAAVTSDSLAQP